VHESIADHGDDVKFACRRHCNHGVTIWPHSPLSTSDILDDDIAEVDPRLIS
jgi:hypothetical protein